MLAERGVQFVRRRAAREQHGRDGCVVAGEHPGERAQRDEHVQRRGRVGCQVEVVFRRVGGQHRGDRELLRRGGVVGRALRERRRARQVGEAFDAEPHRVAGLRTEFLRDAVRQYHLLRRAAPLHARHAGRLEPVIDAENRDVAEGRGGRRVAGGLHGAGEQQHRRDGAR